MMTSTAEQFGETVLAPEAPRARAWRPFPIGVSDLLCVRPPDGDIGNWMHARRAITLLPSRAVVRLESRRSIHVGSDAVLLVPALHMYSVRPLERARSAGIALLLGEGDATELANGGAPALVTRPDLVEAMNALLTELSDSVRPIGGASGVVALVERLAGESTSVPLARTGTTATPLSPLRDYLRAHLNQSLPTPKLAEMSGLTESHFIRAFHHEFGLPPHAYHLRLRLAHACEPLARGESVSTVAYDFGFADQSHLSRKFKEVYHIAPGAWASAVGRRTPRGRPVRGAPVLKVGTRATPMAAERWSR